MAARAWLLTYALLACDRERGSSAHGWFETDCHDGRDNDHDGWSDCHDADCRLVAACQDCGDALSDGDGDGLAGCEDPDCAFACGEVCGNGADDDGLPATDPRVVAAQQAARKDPVLGSALLVGGLVGAAILFVVYAALRDYLPSLFLLAVVVGGGGGLSVGGAKIAAARTRLNLLAPRPY